MFNPLNLISKIIKGSNQKELDRIQKIVKNIKYTQNKLIWMKAAMGIITTDTKPKLAMSECKIGSTNIKNKQNK